MKTLKPVPKISYPRQPKRKVRKGKTMVLTATSNYEKLKDQGDQEKINYK